MVDETTAYLDRLAIAVRGLPDGVATEVIAGVREELGGLDEADARQRMAELGDPEFIAASALAELPAAARRPEPLWYTVLTTLLLAFGGALVPMLGWLVGVVLLWTSRIWTRRDKVLGTLALPAIGIVAVAAFTLAGSGIEVPSNGEAINPLMPGGFSSLASGLLVAMVVAPLVTTPYLLLRARRLRGERRQ